MVESNPANDLRDALAAFETGITRPVVSGELANWIDEVNKTWRAVSPLVQQHIRQLHPKQYEEIAEADAALLHQIELMRAEDEAIDQEREKLDHTISRLSTHLPRLEPDEAKAQPHVESLMEQAIALVTRVRKHEVAVQTWFAEAFNRERGGGD